YARDPFAAIAPLEERRGRRKPVSLPPKVIERAISSAWRLAKKKPPWYVLPGEWAQNAAIIELIYLTASRSSQILRLRRDQVQRRDGVRTLVFPPHKGGLERVFVI